MGNLIQNCLVLCVLYNMWFLIFSQKNEKCVKYGRKNQFWNWRYIWGKSWESRYIWGFCIEKKRVFSWKIDIFQNIIFKWWFYKICGILCFFKMTLSMGNLMCFLFCWMYFYQCKNTSLKYVASKKMKKIWNMEEKIILKLKIHVEKPMKLNLHMGISWWKKFSFSKHNTYMVNTLNVWKIRSKRHYQLGIRRLFFNVFLIGDFLFSTYVASKKC